MFFVGQQFANKFCASRYASVINAISRKLNLAGYFIWERSQILRIQFPWIS